MITEYRVEPADLLRSLPLRYIGHVSVVGDCFCFGLAVEYTPETHRAYPIYLNLCGAAISVVGLEEGCLPDFLAQSDEALAEELRLFYVGMTRARHILYLTNAQQVASYSGRLWTKQRSRFLDYIPSQMVDNC